MRDPAKRRLWMFVLAISFVMAVAILKDWWQHS